MDEILNKFKTEIYDKCDLEISNFRLEAESKEYEACKFDLNGLTIIYRTAKITPKKAGQFVTFWKRSEAGPIEPFHESDKIDFYLVTVQTDHKLGQFVFPKAVLIKKGIISTESKEGKRAFRVYPSWDLGTSKHALQTQKWQLDYFYEVDDKTDFNKMLTSFQKL